MFAYCLNNPVSRSDPSGAISGVSLIKGVISAVTSVSCALINGERGSQLIDNLVLGFACGYFDWLGKAYSVIDSILTGAQYAEKTDNALLGFIVGFCSYGVSLFTGDNISKLKWVNKMDDAAELFFDAFFGYGANTFNTAMWNEIAEYFENPGDIQGQTSQLTTNQTQSKYSRYDAYASFGSSFSYISMQ